MSRLPGMGFYPTPESFRPFNAFGDNPSATTTLLQLALQSLTGRGGYSMMGVNDRNLFDRFEQERLTFRHQQMVAEAVKMDESRAVQAFGTMFRSFGMPFGESQRTAADFYARGGAYALPIMAQIAPDFTDSLFGRAGSSTVFTHYAEMATRNRYNPYTGEFEMPQGQANRLMRSVQQEMFGGQNYLSALMPQGRTGQLWAGLQSQGLMPGQSTLEDLRTESPVRAERIANMFGKNSADALTRLSPKERDALLNMPEVQSELASFDASKVTNTLRQWSKSVDAMRDIFGDAGRPDAPMQELLTALRTMTSGGINQLNPTEASNMVRQIRNLAKNSGLGIEQAMAMVESASNRAQQLGIEPMFGMIAGAEGMAFAQGLQNGRLAVQGWGQPDINTVTQARMALATSAIASPQQNRVGLLMRLSEKLDFTPGSDAANYMDAIKRGQTTFSMGGRQSSMIMDDAAFANMVAGSSGGRLTADEVIFQSGNAWANREATAKNPFLLRSTLRLANEEFAGGTLAGYAASAFGNEVRKVTGKSDPATLSNVLGRAMGRAVMSKEFSPSFFGGDAASKKARDEFLMKTIENDSEFQALAARDPAAAAFLRSSVQNRQLAYSMAYDTTASQIQQDKGITLNTYVHTLSQDQDEIATRAGYVAWAQGQMQAALAPTGTGSPLRRFAESLQTPGGKSIPELALAAFGSVRGDEVVAALQRKGKDGSSFQSRIQSQMDRLKAAEHNLAVAKDTDKTAAADALMAEQQAMAIVWRDFAGNFDATMWDPTADPTSISGALSGTTRLRERLGKGALGKGDMEGYQADMNLFFDSFQKGGANAFRLGAAGMAKVAEIKKLQTEIEKGGLTKEDDPLISKQQALLSDLYKQIEGDKEDAAKGGRKEYTIGRLIINDKDFGNASLELGGDEEGP